MQVFDQFVVDLPVLEVRVLGQGLQLEVPVLEVRVLGKKRRSNVVPVPLPEGCDDWCEVQSVVWLDSRAQLLAHAADPLADAVVVLDDVEGFFGGVDEVEEGQVCISVDGADRLHEGDDGLEGSPELAYQADRHGPFGAHLRVLQEERELQQ